MNQAFLGIDIAKAKFDVCLLGAAGGHYHAFANNQRGFADLVAWLARRQVTSLHACLEATSTYGQALATFLHTQGHTVSVVNPLQIKAFAQSELRRTKTDKVDAALIARFCRAMAPRPWVPPTAGLSELQALARRLEALKDMHTQEANRLQVPGAPATVQASIQAVLQALEGQIAAIERQIDLHLDQHPDLKAQCDLLDSIPGVGHSSAIVLRSELGNPTDYQSARQVAAQAGLVPSQRQSGSSLRGKAHLSKRGNARLRRGLYWPAITAMRKIARFAAFSQRQRQQGKKGLVIVAAVMRKLVELAFAILKKGRPFDPHYLPALP
jgi:transposase